jgi:hypothetical protein
MGVTSLAFAIGILAWQLGATAPLHNGGGGVLAAAGLLAAAFAWPLRPDRACCGRAGAGGRDQRRLGLRGLAGRAAPRRRPARRVGGARRGRDRRGRQPAPGFRAGPALRLRGGGERRAAAAEDLAGLVQGLSRRGAAHAAAPPRGRALAPDGPPQAAPRQCQPHGFDYERWLLEQGIRATGYVRPAPDNQRLDAFVPGFMYGVERLREGVRSASAGPCRRAPTPACWWRWRWATSARFRRSCGECLRGRASPTWWRSAGCT